MTERPRIIAYAFKSDFHCPGCARDRFPGLGVNLFQDSRDSEDNPVSPVFSTNWDFFQEPRACGSCGAELSEGVEFRNAVDQLRACVEDAAEQEAAAFFPGSDYILKPGASFRADGRLEAEGAIRVAPYCAPAVGPDGRLKYIFLAIVRGGPSVDAMITRNRGRILGSTPGLEPVDKDAEKLTASDCKKILEAWQEVLEQTAVNQLRACVEDAAEQEAAAFLPGSDYFRLELGEHFGWDLDGCLDYLYLAIVRGVPNVEILVSLSVEILVSRKQARVFGSALGLEPLGIKSMEKNAEKLTASDCKKILEAWKGKALFLEQIRTEEENANFPLY